MNSLTSSPAVDVLRKLFAEAASADKSLHDSFADGSYSVEKMLQEDRRDFRKLCEDQVEYFLNVSPDLGRFLYVASRAVGARGIVEFGTSFGISSIYLACAVRDNGGGRLIGTELEPAKAERAIENIKSAGLDDLVEIRVGDALETLRSGIVDPIDVVLLDGAYNLYLPVLKLLEPHLAPGALIIADNAIDLEGAYLSYVQNAENGYYSIPLPFHPDRGNHLSLYTKTE